MKAKLLKDKTKQPAHLKQYNNVAIITSAIIGLGILAIGVRETIINRHVKKPDPLLKKIILH